ncbi:hypothetical protein PIB30_106903, partial [Stylosanthes scabra]|nr:hypothetical protein [Stylosanthes scabra]
AQNGRGEALTRGASNRTIAQQKCSEMVAQRRWKQQEDGGSPTVTYQNETDLRVKFQQARTKKQPARMKTVIGRRYKAAERRFVDDGRSSDDVRIALWEGQIGYSQGRSAAGRTTTGDADGGRVP